MQHTDHLLSEAPVPAGLHVVQLDENTLAGIRRTPERRASIVRTIRGRKCRTVPALFDEMAAALQFPYYFGENWDALDEVLRDLTELAPVVLLLFSGADALLSGENEAKFSILARLLAQAHAYWGAPERRVSFHAVLQGATAEACARITERLVASKQPFDVLDGA